MKKFLNDPEDVVRESLSGLLAAHDDLLRVDLDHAVVVRADSPVESHVGIVSGGGSGHEPMHAGFVGPGMLDAACCGAVFTSPTPDAILAATRAVDSGRGVLHIVKNYTGDILNFRLAAGMAADEGIEVATAVIHDDVATADSPDTAGRRGTGVTVLAEKLAGAAAAEGASLEEVAAVATRANERGRSIGVALSSCVTPASGRPTIDLGPDEMEFGVGIHGEPGRAREAIQPAGELAARMVAELIADLQPSDGSGLLAFISGLGGTPLMEQYLMFNEVKTQLDASGLRVERSLVGNYMTSLEMAGISLSLLELDEDFVRLWDAPVRTAGLRWGT